MKSLMILGSSLLITLGNFTTATADHRRQLDDMAFAVLADSREVRWAVRDDFTHSADLRYLCREADDVFATARNLQDAIFRGRTQPVICNNICSVETELSELEAVLRNCDLARLTVPRFSGRHNSHSLTAGSLHAGGHPVPVLQGRIDQIRQTLAAMHTLIDSVNAGPGYVPQPYPVNPPLPAVPSAPAPYYRGTPSQPGPSLPAPVTRNDGHIHGHRTDPAARNESRLTSFSLGGLRVKLAD